MASTINASNTGFGGIVQTGDSSGTLALQAAGTTVATVSSTGLAVTGTITTGGVVGSPYSMKNRIINGDMRIDQRNAGASISNNTTGTQFSLDRWLIYGSQASKFNIQQNASSVTPPTGFTNYLGCTSTSAYTVTSTDEFDVIQRIEGYNMSDFAWGTANAKTVTLSFWARSSLTGTFGGVFGNSSLNRVYVFSYTISAANTWEYKTVTITGDTTGTWDSTNGKGIQIYFSLGCGSTYQGTTGSWGSTLYLAPTGQTSVVGTNGATWYITGVQLEVGSSATSFEWRPYGMELSLCQRYCYKDGGDIANQYSNTPGGYYDANYLTFGLLRFPVTMRSQPSLTQYGTPVVYQTASQVSTTMTSWNITISGNPSNQFCYLDANKSSHGITPSILYVVKYPTTSDYFIFSAEL